MLQPHPVSEVLLQTNILAMGGHSNMMIPQITCHERDMGEICQKARCFFIYDHSYPTVFQYYYIIDKHAYFRENEIACCDSLIGAIQSCHHTKFHLTISSVENQILSE